MRSRRGLRPWCGTSITSGPTAVDGTQRNENSLQAPISIYEVHLGSWMRVPEEDNRSLSYREWPLGWRNM